MARYRGDIDAGKLNPEKVRGDYKAGKLRERDASTLIEEAKTTQLLRDFRPLSVERALEVWDLAGDEERVQLLPILQKKKSQLENRVRQNVTKLEEKLRAALSQKKAPSPAIPGALRKLLLSSPLR